MLDEIVRRIREAVDPDKIILFGSRARGDAGPDSDYDILIIAPSDQPRWRRSAPLYSTLAGLGAPKDVVWWTRPEADDWRNVKSHFVTTAMREGRLLYARAG
ncbi:MAG: nucleotidyltransferase domain-containing protein [Armatimonadetes bacterium]|nr:nucleotidyltransferase domain-containing protein [Armatimonadota bacterium]